MKITLKTLFLALSFLFLGLIVDAQEDLLAMLDEDEEAEQNLTIATFKGSRLINGHTVMTRKKKSLEFIIAHRFGRLNSGLYELYGLDNSNVRFGLDYGLTDRITVGVGRNSFEKTYDGFFKFALLRQQKGKYNIPLSVVLFGSSAIKTLRIDPEESVNPIDNMVHTGQLLIASKISDALSLQLMPTFVHQNEIESTRSHDLFALGAGGRLKITKRISINAEYVYRFSERELEFYDPIALGVDIETGGHVFQLQFTNSRSMVEKGFIRETTGNIANGDIHFGFNITRVF